MSDGGTVKRLLREQVAEEVRALLARRMITGADVATAIGKSPMYVSRRVRGEVAFDLDDIERIAKVLDVEIGELFPNRERGSSRDFDQAPADGLVTKGQGSVEVTKRVRHTPRRRTKTRPFDHPKPGMPGPSRPVSAVPARKRRPQPVRPGDRPAGR